MPYIHTDKPKLKKMLKYDWNMNSTVSQALLVTHFIRSYFVQYVKRVKTLGWADPAHMEALANQRAKQELLPSSSEL